MSVVDEPPVLELDELLDSSRLAAAWQAARERAEQPAVTGGAVEAASVEVSAPAEISAPAEETPVASAASPAIPAIPPPLPVAIAYRVLLDELARTAAAAGLGEAEERGLAVPEAKLAAALDPLDAGAAEQALDELEDLLQSLLAPRWPTAGEE